MTAHIFHRARFSALLAVGLMLTCGGYANAAFLDLDESTAVASTVFGGTTFPAKNAFDGSSTTRFISELDDEILPHWVYVDLGEDLKLNEVQIDWRNDQGYTPAAFQILMRTDAQGATSDPSNWTEVAALTGGSSNTTLQIDHFFDFSTNSFTAASPGIGGTGTFSGGTGPVGRYLMISETALSGTALGMGVWEVYVDAQAVPEPTGIALSMLSMVGLLAFRRRKRN